MVGILLIILGVVLNTIIKIFRYYVKNEICPLCKVLLIFFVEPKFFGGDEKDIIA
jgi:hypothetical protein